MGWLIILVYGNLSMYRKFAKRIAKCALGDAERVETAENFRSVDLLRRTPPLMIEYRYRRAR